MKFEIHQTAAINGACAAKCIAAKLNEAIKENGSARLLLSTGASQFEMFEALVKEDVDWTKVTMFHLDEYVALPESHIASFRKYLKERFVQKLPTPLAGAYFVDGEGDVESKIAELTEIIAQAPIDVGVIGIGENGHIAFNDPPADFETEATYIRVKLDDKCRHQQVGEGWFATADDVPEYALSMTPRAIMRCRTIISVVPHSVKADAIYATFSSKVCPEVPATLLKRHPDWTLFMDYDSAEKILNVK